MNNLEPKKEDRKKFDIDLQYGQVEKRLWPICYKIKK